MNDQRSISIRKKLVWGVLLLVVPLGTVVLYAYVKQWSEARNRAQEAGAAYEDTALRQIDPDLVKYREVGQLDTGLKGPRAIAVDSTGQVYVGGDKLVRIFSPTSQPVKDIPLSDSPYCLAVGTQGRVYVGMKDHVEVFSPDGQRLAAWPSWGHRAYLTSLAVANNEVYVANAGERVVYRCNLDGKVLAELAKADPARGILGLIVPSPHLDVAVAGDGLIWIANPGRHQLEAYDPNGELQRFWGRPGTDVESFLGCCNPSDFALLADGRFVTAEKGVPRVKVYLADGRFDCVVVGPEAFGDYAGSLDVAIDKDNRVLVLQPGATMVRMYARKE